MHQEYRKMMMLMFSLLVCLASLSAQSDAKTIHDAIIEKGYDPKNLVKIGGRSYFIAENMFVNYYDAEFLCNGLDMTMVNLETKEEDDLIQEFMLNNGITTPWFSTSGVKVNEMWMWSGSGTPFDYTNWEAGQPNFQGTEDTCVYFHIRTGWSDEACSMTNPVMCEQLD